MQFRSTRGADERVDFSTALLRGLAPDGGLYVPLQWPEFESARFAPARTLAEVGERLVAPFAAGDRLAAQVPAIVRDAFNFPAPLHRVSGTAAGEQLLVLELFHGPTAAFKDFGARFLAACFERLREPQDPVAAELAKGDLSVKRTTRVIEEILIRRALERTKGNRTRAADLLEISHRALLYKIKEYGIS